MIGNDSKTSLGKKVERQLMKGVLKLGSMFLVGYCSFLILRLLETIERQLDYYLAFPSQHCNFDGFSSISFPFETLSACFILSYFSSSQYFSMIFDNTLLSFSFLGTEASLMQLGSLKTSTKSVFGVVFRLLESTSAE